MRKPSQTLEARKNEVLTDQFCVACGSGLAATEAFIPVETPALVEPVLILRRHLICATGLAFDSTGYL
jgi:hypothetical protein